MQTNILGTKLELCCTSPMTGFYRDGLCRTAIDDRGTHTVCVQITKEFLDFCKLVGNDLSTPALEHNFPGLKPGDKWCLCALRWLEAYELNKAPKIFAESTSNITTKIIPKELLLKYKID